MHVSCFHVAGVVLANVFLISITEQKKQLLKVTIINILYFLSLSIFGGDLLVFVFPLQVNVFLHFVFAASLSFDVSFNLTNAMGVF